MTKLVIFATRIIKFQIMVKKKAKEEVTKNPKPETVASNRVENEEENLSSVSTGSDKKPIVLPSTEGLAGSDFDKDTELITTPEEQPAQEEQKPKLHVLASDRLNALIDDANELGITDVVQMINSDKYGQCYMVYRA
jgi:hypothetical protein